MAAWHNSLQGNALRQFALTPMVATSYDDKISVRIAYLQAFRIYFETASGNFGRSGSKTQNLGHCGRRNRPRIIPFWNGSGENCGYLMLRDPALITDRVVKANLSGRKTVQGNKHFLKIVIDFEIKPNIIDLPAQQ